MKYFGLSNDENILFTDEKIIVLKENNGNKSIESFLYDSDSLVYILQVAKSGYKRKLMEGKIDSISYITSPRKFLVTLLETFEFEESFKMNILIDWDKKFSNVFGLLSEGVNGLTKSNLINEGWDYINVLSEQFWEYLGKGAKALGQAALKGAKAIGGAIGKGLKAATQKIILPILKQGVLPFLRWIRRNLNTYMGMIVDVVASMFPTAIVLRIIWGLIVMMDIYEILTGDYDPYDPERKQAPFLFLITDIISLLFTQAVGMTAKVGLKSAIKAGVTSGPTKKILAQLIDSLPKLRGFLNSANAFVTKVFGKNAGKFISSVFNGIDTILTKLVNWIKTTFNFKAGAEAIVQTGQQLATKQGVKKLVGGVIGGYLLADLVNYITAGNSLKRGSKGDLVKSLQNSLIAITKDYPQVNFKGPVDGDFGVNTENAIKKVQEILKLPVTGVFDSQLSLALAVDA